jgi:speckle-type POZ protein
VKFEVSLTVVKAWTSRVEGLQTAPLRLEAVGPSWEADMLRFYDGRQEHGDLTLVAKGVRMPTHRTLLMARSSVFQAMLGSCGMAESRSDEVVLHETEPASLAELLHYLYTDRLTRPIAELAEAECGQGLELLKHLTSAADRFDLPRLRSLCESELALRLDVATVCETLALADSCHAAPRPNQLLQRCVRFVARHADAVMATDGFAALAQSRCFRSKPLLQSSKLLVHGVSETVVAWLRAGPSY